MGDDVTVVVPPVEPIEDDTYEKAGEELVALLTAQAERLGECLARLTELESRISELAAREWAEIEHSHEGFALAEHDHDGRYAPAEHSHEIERPPEREPDHPPEKQHPYFRKLSDF